MPPPSSSSSRFAATALVVLLAASGPNSARAGFDADAIMGLSGDLPETCREVPEGGTISVVDDLTQCFLMNVGECQFCISDGFPAPDIPDSLPTTCDDSYQTRKVLCSIEKCCPKCAVGEDEEEEGPIYDAWRCAAAGIPGIGSADACPLNCDEFETETTTAATTPAGGSATTPAGGAVVDDGDTSDRDSMCKDSLVAYSTCLGQNMGTCSSCVMASLGEGFDDIPSTCNELDTFLCGIKDCCDQCEIQGEGVVENCAKIAEDANASGRTQECTISCAATDDGTGGDGDGGGSAAGAKADDSGARRYSGAGAGAAMAVAGLMLAAV